jgi:Domain of unknown function (DUF6268)
MFFALTSCTIAFAQEYTTDTGYDYTLFYNHNSASLYRHRANAKVETGNIKYGFDINSYTVDYSGNLPFLPQDLENVLSLQGSFAYKTSLSRSWNVNLYFAPHLSWATNLYTKLNNIIPEGGLSFTKKFEGAGNAKLEFGVSYGTTFGKPAIIPILSYEARLNNLRITAGIPKTEISYSLSAQHSISALAGISSLYTKLPDYNYYTEGTNKVQTLNEMEWVNISAALGYTYTSGSGWDATFTLGKTVYNTFRMYDNNNQYLNVGFNKNLWASLGFNYKLNFKK